MEWDRDYVHRLTDRYIVAGEIFGAASCLVDNIWYVYGGAKLSSNGTNLYYNDLVRLSLNGTKVLLIIDHLEQIYIGRKRKWKSKEVRAIFLHRESKIEIDRDTGKTDIGIEKKRERNWG